MKADIDDDRDSCQFPKSDTLSRKIFSERSEWLTDDFSRAIFYSLSYYGS